MPAILKFVLFTVTLFLSVLHSQGATATLLVGQTYQTEISSSGYHYIAIESVTSSNPSVSTSKMGLVAKATINAYFPGESTITIRLKYQLYPGQSYQYRNQQFTLACNNTSINLSPTSANVKVGESYQLGYGFNRTTYVTPSITWSSSDENIATVSSSGMVYGKSIGSATIYAKSNLGSNVSTCSVTVSNSGSSGNDNPGTSGADKSWYDSSKNEFTLNSASQLLGLRDLVNSGSDFTNKTIVLSNDIDLSNVNWTTPIGSTSVPFKGNFDGKNHYINIYIDKTYAGSNEYYYFGFFGNAWGIIKNLTIKGSVKIDIAGSSSYCYVGALCGSASSLESCINEASLEYIRSYVKTTGNSDRIGGLSGNISQSSINCINRGNILCKTKYSSANTNDYQIGGITGYCGTTTGCCNYGSVKNETSNSGRLREYIGGITGWSVSNKLLRCSNFGDIQGTSDLSSVGGIIGGSGGGTSCSNSYVGKCTIGNTNGGSAVYVNSICGQLKYSNETFTGNFEANDIVFQNKRNGESGNSQYSSTQMRTIEFADKLGSEYWLGTDGQYPVVKGSPEEFNNYACYISELTCQSAKIKTNINAVLGPSVKSWGILTTKDDGKESYMRCISEDYSALLTDLSPNRTYKVRWYAQDINGIEYYSMPTYFITYPINPITLTASDITTSSCKLEANYFYEGKSNCGFYVEQEDEENGFYIWDVEMEGEKYTCQVNNLKGNTAYEFFAVCQIDGINYDGNQLPFKTASIYTLSPSEFTDDSAQINGEVGIDSNNVYFEYRSSSTPSVIESSEIIATIKDSRASATLTNLILDETYKYRIAAISGDTKLFGNWVEFKFKGTAGISDCYTDKDYDLEIYNLNGVRIDGDINSLSSGIYIIKQGNTSHKILIQ